jgi:membrane protein DedA with SNARE-associated domain
MLWPVLLIVLGVLIGGIFSFGGPFSMILVLPPLIVVAATLVIFVTVPLWYRWRVRRRPEPFTDRFSKRM